MICPYCGGQFRISRTISRDDERLLFGLVECRCFTFPIIDGILLLSLAKGYGGAEEALQPYVPLQAAAIEYLERDDVRGLKAWIRRHAALVADLLESTDETYLSLWSRLSSELGRHADALLSDCRRYEVLGSPKPGLATSLRRRLTRASQSDLPTTADFYAARFFSPRVNAMALQLDAFPDAQRLLSLCCGHGAFENLLRAKRHTGDVVSMDAQIVNLLITRRYADHGGSYICHDAQFPLPFSAGTFDGVFSSTCLPEIPTQLTFASEAIRVTSERGWTDFDSIWNTDMVGVARVDRGRHYRFAQNFFARLDDYVPMFEACAGPRRRVGLNVPDTPAAYVDSPRWSFGPDIFEALHDRADDLISVVVLGEEFPGFVESHHAWLPDSDLAASLAFVVSRTPTRIDLGRRPEFGELHPAFAPRRFRGYAEQATLDLRRFDEDDYVLDAYAAALVSVVPNAFTTDASRDLPAGIGRGPAGAPEHESTGT